MDTDISKGNEVGLDIFKINLHELFKEFHETDFYKEVYKGKSLGDIMPMEE